MDETEKRVRILLGDMMISQVALQVQLEAANLRISELEKPPKPADEPQT